MLLLQQQQQQIDAPRAAGTLQGLRSTEATQDTSRVYPQQHQRQQPKNRQVATQILKRIKIKAQKAATASRETGEHADCSSCCSTTRRRRGGKRGRDKGVPAAVTFVIAAVYIAAVVELQQQKTGPTPAPAVRYAAAVAAAGDRSNGQGLSTEELQQLLQPSDTKRFALNRTKRKR